MTATTESGGSASPTAASDPLGTLKSADGEQVTALPEVAVVIPAYKQPEYLKEAAISAIRQSMADRTKVVIVNDGCPYSSTDAVGRFFRSAYPERVCYLRKPNGGLSSARNRGIQFALSAWPSVRAVFPLDSDNRLSGHTLATLLETLDSSGEDVGWIYQDQIRFGSDEHVWHVGVPFSRYRLLFENFSDAGSLIARRVYDAGVWYDESMKDGYEDWEFFIHASTRGFQGRHREETDFLYRRRESSMLAGASRQKAAIHGYIRAKHRDAFHPASLTRLEHSEMPRFSLVALDKEEVRQVTLPDRPGRTINLERFLEETTDWLGEQEPRSTYLPPITVLSGEGALASLADSALLPGVLFLLQHRLDNRPVASLALRAPTSPASLRAELAAPTSPAAIAVALTALGGIFSEGPDRVADRLGKLVEAEDRQLVVELGAAHAPRGGQPLASSYGFGGGLSLIDRFAAAVARRGGSVSEPSQEGIRPPEDKAVGSHSFFAAAKHIAGGETTFPYTGADASGGGPDVYFVTAWIRLGGVDQIVLNVARALAASDPSCRVHLVVTEANEIEADPIALAPFKTVTLLAEDLRTSDEDLVSLLSGADAIVNAHSRSAYRVLPELKTRASPIVISMLQVIDFRPDGKPTGYPLVAAREVQNLVDYLVVPSQQLRRSCRVFGMPEEKMRVIPNAPVVHRPSLADALSAVAEKSRRRFSAETPVRVLFAGRFDRQKGFDRLPAIARLLADEGVPFELRILGKPVLSRPEELPSIPGAVYLPPAVDPLELKDEYEAADVFLLPSRWEGLPLSILEAMSFGALTVSTDVGAIAEVVESGTNGVLVSGRLDEDQIAAELAASTAAFARAPERYLQMRRSAARTAMGFTWEGAAAELRALIPAYSPDGRTN